MNTTYKGFTITQADSNTRFYVDGLSGNGYATEAGAKGAITKRLSAVADKVTDIIEAAAVAHVNKAVTFVAEQLKNLSTAFANARAGYAKPKDTRSRSVREGRVVGFCHGKPVRIQVESATNPSA